MINRGLINKFFAGNASQEEARKVLNWIKSSQFEADLQQLFNHYSNNKEVDGEWDEYDQLRKLKSRLRTQNKLDNYDQILTYSHPSNKNKLALLLKIAASIIFILLVGFAANRFLIEDEDKLATANKIPLIEKYTSNGQKSTIYLEDGSKVELNSDSKITFPQTFNSEIRLVTLEGEAFFQVKSDMARPFLVKTGDVITKAVGTSFNINSYHDDHIISLVTGKVVVQKENDNQQQEHWLKPGEQIAYQQEEYQKSTFDKDRVTAWKDGILYFDQARFNEIVNRLERWYGVEIEVVNKSTNTKHYSGKFNNESLENVLQGIGFINDFNFEINGKQVKIKFN